MIFKVLAACVALLCAVTSWAGDPFTIQDIRVEGIQRTEAGTVFSYLPIKVGDILDEDKSIAAIKALYATGFFKDIKKPHFSGIF